MTGLINEAAQHWWNWVAPMFWQVALVIVIVGLIDFAIRRWAWPQVRYALWLLVLVKLVLPPSLSSPASLTAGVLAIGSPDSASDRRLEITLTPDDSALNYAAAVQEPAQYAPSGTPGAAVAAGRPALTWRSILMGVWFCGAVILGCWAAARFRRLRRDFRTTAGPDPHGELLESLAAQLKLRGVPGLAFSPRVSSPAVFGVFRPVLVLPEEYRHGTPGASVRYALLHELAHVRRGDLLLHAVFMVLQILYWFHPLLWWVRRRMQQARELCCDATVAGLLKDETQDYRQTLLHAAERFLNRPRLSTPEGLGFLGLIERPGDLLSRLRWLEKDTGRRCRLRTAAIATTVLAMVATVLPMAKYEAAAGSRGAGDEYRMGRAGAPALGEAVVRPVAAESKRKIVVRLHLVQGPKTAVGALEQQLAPADSAKEPRDRTAVTPGGPATEDILSTAAILPSWEGAERAIRENEDMVKLAAPVLTVFDGDSATVMLGQKIPYPVFPDGSRKNARPVIEQKEVGLWFFITAGIVDEKSMAIDLTYENKEIVGWNKIGPFLRKVRVPVIQSVKSHTNLILPQDHVAMLRAAKLEAVPGKSKKKRKENEARLIFVTAHVEDGTTSEPASGTMVGDPASAKEVKSDERTLRFPDDRSIGVLFTRDRGTDLAGWSEFGAARGTVTVPAGKDLLLRTRNEGRKGLAALARLKPDDLQVLDLSTPQSFDDLKFGITHSIPPEEFANLRGLRGLGELILSRTGIDDEGLANLEGLTAVQSLTLSQNPIRGAGLSRLANMKSLRYLDLSFTQVDGSGLSDLKALPALEELFLNWCPIHDEDLPALQHLGALKRLSLFRTYITDAGLIHLRNLTQLEDLTLSNHFEITTNRVGRPITGEGLVHLKGMRSLRRLWLSGTSVQGKNLAPLQKLTTLEELSLEDAPVGDEGLRHVATLHRLKHLRVGNTGITDPGLAHLANLTSLEILNLNGNKITDAGLVHLAGLKSLTHLRLEHTSVEGPGLAHLADMPALEILVLDDSPVTDAGLAQLRGFKSLRSLRLIRTRVTPEGLERVKQILPDCNARL